MTVQSILYEFPETLDWVLSYNPLKTAAVSGTFFNLPFFPLNFPLLCMHQQQSVDSRSGNGLEIITSVTL